MYKTAFVTPDGQYKFLQMPFGMVNSGATLILGLKKVLEELSGVGSYIDDIIVYNDSWEEHVAHNVARLAPQSELNLYISLICLN